MPSSYRAQRHGDSRTPAWISGLACVIGSAVSALAFPDPQYKYDAWDAEDGLPQNTVKAIYQTSDGYLWLSTRFGIARFNGVAFQTFDRIRTPDLTFDNCLSFAEDKKDKSLWLAVPQGVVQYKNSEFIPRRFYKGDRPEKVTAICASLDGGVWLGSLSGLIRLTDRATNYYSVADGLTDKMVHAISETPERLLWVASGYGLQRFDPRTGRFENVWVSSPQERVQLTSLCLGRDGALWIGSTTAGLRRLQSDSFTDYTTRDGLTSNHVEFLATDSETNLWVATGEGTLLHFRDGRFDRYGKKEGLTDDFVMCAYEDRERNLWIGTAFGGLNRMQLRRLRTLSTRDGLAHNNVWSVAEGRNGFLWIGTDVGVSCWQNGVFTNYYPLGGTNVGKAVTSVLEDRNGVLWAGTRGAGVKRLQGGQVTHYSVGSNPEHDEVNALYESRAGQLWIGAPAGLFRLEKDRITVQFTRQDGLGDDVRAIREDREGNLWIGTYGGGVTRLRDGEFKTFTTRDGLSDNFAWCLREDSDGVFWIGTEHGLTRLKDGVFTPITTRHGLFDNVINDILEDHLGSFWIACNRGIYRVSKQQLNDVADGRAAQVDYVLYGTSDGMLSSETNGENQPVACKTRDGMLCFPTTQGIVLIEPGEASRNELEPPVVLEQVEIDRKPVDPGRQARLGPGRGQLIQFRYTANSLVAPDKVRFKYCLDGCDTDWTDAGNRRVAYYTNLRPGDYTFRVLACNNHGVWNESGASFAFYLAPYFYQTRSFYLGAALVVLLAAYGIHRFRLEVVRKIERLRQQHALEKERARIANEMHDDLGSSLTQITLLSELARRELSENRGACDHLNKIGSTTREVFQSLDEIVWAVNPRKDSLDSLVAYLCKYAQEFLRPTGIRCRLDVPEILPHSPLTAEERHNLFLAFKEALNNIVRHASATEVWIRVKVTHSTCQISVEDDGSGFSPDSCRPDGNGLGNMRRRLAAIGGEFELQSLPGKGTRLDMKVGLKHTGPASLTE